MSIVYVCHSLRGSDLADVRDNCASVRPIAAQLLRDGHLPLVPHYFAERGVLDPFHPDEDAIGRLAALRMLELADEVRVYGPVSEGMAAEIGHAAFIAQRWEKRRRRGPPVVRFM